MKNIKFYQNLKNFRKFLKISENFLIKNFFEKKNFFDKKKLKKNCKKKFLKIWMCYIPFCSEFNSEQNGTYKHRHKHTFNGADFPP